MMQGIYLRDEKWLERRRKGIGKKTEFIAKKIIL